METANIKKKIHLVLVALIFYIQKGTGFSTSPSPHTSCASSTANISYIFSTDASESIIGNRIWFFGTSKIAESDGTTLTPVQSYSSRLTAYGTSGISLSNIAIADAGTYTYVIVLLPSGSPFTATASLSVQVAPLAPPSGCQVSSNQPSSIPTCTVDTVSGKCGTPSLNAFLVNSTNTSSQFMCNVGETYQCCATGAALACYSGSPNDFCKLFICTAAQTTTPSTTPNETVTSTSSTSTPLSSTTIKTTTSNISSTATGSTATTSVTSTSSSKSHTAGSTINATSTSKPTTPKTIESTSSPTNHSSQGDTDTKVIIIAVVVPIGGLLLIGIIVLCICYHRKENKDHDIRDDMAAQDIGNNMDGSKHNRTAKQFNAIPTTSDGFIIYPGPAAMSTARPNKKRKDLDVGYQYKTPYTGYQTAYDTSTYPSAPSYTHKDTKHNNVGHPYSRPYTGTYGNQTPYSSKNKSYDYESPYRIAASRPDYDQPGYYPQNGYYEQFGQDVYQRGSGQYLYGQRSKPHQDRNGRQRERDYYYNHYEMADYGGSRSLYGQTKRYGLDTANFY